MVKKTADEVYATFGGMLQELARFRGFRPRLEALNQVIRFEIPDAGATVTASFRRGEEFTVTFGAAGVEPDTVVWFSAADADRFLLGQLNPFLAQDTKEMRIEGALRGFLSVVPLMRKFVSPMYELRLKGVPYNEEIARGHAGLPDGMESIGAGREVPPE